MGVIPIDWEPILQVRQISQCRLSQQPANHCQTTNRYRQTPETPNLESTVNILLLGFFHQNEIGARKKKKCLFQSKFPYLKIHQKNVSVDFPT